MAMGIQAARNLGRDVAADGMRKNCGLTELKEMSEEEHAAYCAGWDEKKKEIEDWNALSPLERQALSLKRSEEFAADSAKKWLTECAESLRKMPVICFSTPATPAADNHRLAHRQGIERGIKQWAEEQLKLQPMESGR